MAGWVSPKYAYHCINNTIFILNSMQKKFIKLLKKLRRRYIERHGLPQHSPLNKEMNPDIISSHIKKNYYHQSLACSQDLVL